MIKKTLLSTLLITTLALAGCGGGGADTETIADLPPPTGGNPPPADPAPSTGNIQIEWTPPVEKTDGSALTDLAGYKFYYGTTSGEYDQVISVANPGLSVYVIDNLPADTYYVAMSAYRANSIESDLSNEVVKVAN